ncbi:hypothetical protein PM082_018900 [Marasmius tenuissimus]|nr:hypothetical protein PM082_018900 [Marasmius tenuissimus]
MDFLVSRPRSAHGAALRRDYPQLSSIKSSSGRFHLPPVPQSPVNPTLPNTGDFDDSSYADNQGGDMSIITEGQVYDDGFTAMPTDLSSSLRRSSSKPVSDKSSIMSRVSTIFTPRKRVTSFGTHSVTGGSSLGHSTDQATPATTSTETPETSLTPSTTTSIPGGLTRKGFEPVGHTVKAQKRRSIWKKTPSGDVEKEKASASSLFPASGNMFSSSALSLGIKRTPTKSKKRRASVSGGAWGSVPWQEESEDEIDEIRRPSDLGSAAEIMVQDLDSWEGRKRAVAEAEEGKKGKSLPALPGAETSEPDTQFHWAPSTRPISTYSIRLPPVDQILTNSQIISHILEFLPQKSDVAQLAVVSRTFLVGARRVLYGCLDLRSTVESESGADVDGTSRNHHRKKKRKALGKTLEALVGFSLQERHGELFQDTWGILMDEWPYGWWETDEVDDDDDEGRDIDDGESQYTAYSDSDFASSANPSQVSLPPLDVPQLRSKRSSYSLRSTNATQRRELQQQRRQRYHTLLKTLIASVPSLTTLLLPAFELSILKHHTAFGLRVVTFLNRMITDCEKEALLGWLDGIVSVSEVRLPRLVEGEIEDETSEDGDEAMDGEPERNKRPKLKVNVEAEDDTADEGGKRNTTPTDGEFTPKKKKRKTLLIISPSSDTPDASASNFHGTSFPMPPMSPSSLSPPIGSRPMSMLSPGLLPPSPSIPTPSSPSSIAARHATPPGSRNSSPITPITPITPMSPLTPFTPSFYMHSSSSTSSPSLATFPSPDTEKRIREFGKKETLLPELRVLHGPPSLVELLVPRRRRTVREVRVNVHGTIIGGQVKVGEIVKALVKRKAAELNGLGLGATGVEKDGKAMDVDGQELNDGDEDDVTGRFECLAFHFSRNVDRRTMEKVLASAGAAVCGTTEGEPRGNGQNSGKVVDTLEVVAPSTVHANGNSRKSDEAVYKTIHAVLPRYQSLRGLIMRLADPETGEVLPATLTNDQAMLPPTLLPYLNSGGDSAGVINSTIPNKRDDTPAAIHTPLENKDLNLMTNGGHAQLSPHQSPVVELPPSYSPSLLAVEDIPSTVTFPSTSTPPLSPSFAHSAEMQKLKDRKMMRRLKGSVSKRTDSSGSSQRHPPPASLRSVSFSLEGTPSSLGGHHGHGDDGDNSETDRETINSNSVKSRVSLSSSRASRRSSVKRKSIGSLKSFTSLQNLSSIVTATKAMAQVVTAKKATLFRTGSVSGQSSAQIRRVHINENGTLDVLHIDDNVASPTTPTAYGIVTPVAVKPIGADLSLSSSPKGKEKENGDIKHSEVSLPTSLPTSPPPAGSTPPNDTSVLTASQRRHIRLWTKQCPSLTKVVFLTGATWERGVSSPLSSRSASMADARPFL